MTTFGTLNNWENSTLSLFERQCVPWTRGHSFIQTTEHAMVQVQHKPTESPQHLQCLTQDQLRSTFAVRSIKLQYEQHLRFKILTYYP